ncbi:pentapeptide repeat-containing protein [Micromonospora sp. NPDC049051]|uniref:pentapeptide repeat-containing protein n=1 Tax=Micromonospora sp. NPDC049051 TaxID=3364264 RepID=UPI003711FEE8
MSVVLMAVGGLVLLSVALVSVPRSWWGVLASGWPVLATVVVGVAVLVAGVLLWRRDGVKHEVSAAPVPPDRQVRPLRSWVISVGVVLVGTVTCAAVAWLQGSVPAVGDGVQRAQLRVESIRTGLTIGAAVTAAFALLLAFRRQQLAERTQQAAEYDAGEKRVTELYVKAADQLGADKAPVRLAGLYALERLAQDNPTHRQSIVEVICAYLRMPYTPSDDQPTPISAAQPLAGGLAPATPTAATGEVDKPAVEPREEHQVRLAAQRILARHLRPITPEGEPHPLYWGPKVTLDLTEAVLIDLDLTGCRLHNATFTKTHFTGVAGFVGATFSGAAGFGAATFSGTAGFGGVTFSGDVEFGAATFTEAGFVGATFSGSSWFGAATFSGDVEFGAATFTGEAVFVEATFSGGSYFVGATFSGDVEFGGATFSGDAWFDRATFSGDARFGGATFTGDARFDEATLSGDAYFEGATFSGDVEFGEATFGSAAGFVGATFSGDASFDRATFGSAAVFSGATFGSAARFGGATFTGVAGFGGATFSGGANFDKATLDGARYDGPESVAE